MSINKELEYICDDRIYEPDGYLDQIRKMSDEEFEKHIKEERKRKALDTTSQ